MRYSVITINYNNKVGLHKTITSVVNQTCKDYEYIIIDGDSTDGSVDVVKEYATAIDYWVSEKDNGVYHAMNKGVAVAKGDYCIFMNSGDCFYSQHVLDNISKKNLCEDIIVGKVVSDTGKIMSPQSEREISLYHLFSGAIPHQGSFIKTQLLKEYPYDEALKIVSDWKFLVKKIILDNCTFTYIDDIIAIYDTNGMSSANPLKMRKEKESTLAEMFPPRVLLDYQYMKQSECKTQLLMPRLRNHYRIDKWLYDIGRFILAFVEK